VDAETTELLRASIRELLETHTGDIANRLEEFGFTEVLDEEPAVAIALLFGEQGAAGKASSALDTVAFVGNPGTTTTRRLIHPISTASAATRSGAHLHIDGVTLAPVEGPALVVFDGSAVEIPAAEVISGSSPASGFDPASGWHRVRMTLPADDATAVDGDWTEATAVVHRALASELVGNGTAMLNLATEQITERTQFGKPIGANQTPRHRLAEAYSLLGGAAELVQAAWRSGASWDARVAKTYAGYAAEATSRACLQLCGAIGLTTEHRLPSYVTRGRLLDALYGGWQQEIDAVGAQLLGEAAVPSAARI
jgi:hypothetical protein